MSSLRELRVLAVDCQASGATPSHGDLLELAWAECGLLGAQEAVRSHHVVPRTQRRVSAAVREITGWSESLLGESLPETQAFEAFDQDVQRMRAALGEEHALMPCVIHVARFELPFLRDLYARLAARELPLDVLCVHAVATRLWPDLPRRNIRALAGFLGHSVGLTRHAAGHVEATAFIWKELVPRLEAQGVGTWSDLKVWLAQPVQGTRSKKRSFPLATERRRALPDAPGVYRFVRKNGDVLYVGKATSLKKRVAGHFRSTGPRTERALELLSQVHDIVITETPSTLEAALLETDEIKAIDPPYNVQLRVQERRAWFATRTLEDARPALDESYCRGPLPSRGAVGALYAMNALLSGAEPSARLCALALAVPGHSLPDDGLFAQGFADFVREVQRAGGEGACRAERAARTLWLERRRAELDESSEDLPPDGWDLARVRRRLDRNLIQAGLILRRARWLCLLADADVAFREAGSKRARALSFARSEIEARHDLERVEDVCDLSVRKVSALAQRKGAFDAARYDRLRVIATELSRVLSEGGDVAVRVGSHLLAGERLRAIVRAV